MKRALVHPPAYMDWVHSADARKVSVFPLSSSLGSYSTRLGPVLVCFYEIRVLTYIVCIHLSSYYLPDLYRPCDSIRLDIVRYLVGKCQVRLGRIQLYPVNLKYWLNWKLMCNDFLVTWINKTHLNWAPFKVLTEMVGHDRHVSLKLIIWGSYKSSCHTIPRFHSVDTSLIFQSAARSKEKFDIFREDGNATASSQRLRRCYGVPMAIYRVPMKFLLTIVCASMALSLHGAHNALTAFWSQIFIALYYFVRYCHADPDKHDRSAF